MARVRRFPPVALFLALVAFYSVVFGARAWHLSRRAVRLETAKPAYLHDEMIELVANAADPALRARWRGQPPRAVVLRGAELVPTIAGLRSVELAFDGRAWRGLWPCPWNAPDGEYRLALVGEPALEPRVRARAFRIERRRPRPLAPGFAALTFESVRELATLRVRGPSGELGDWRTLFDWVEYIEADAFWVLGGQTPGEKPGELWLSRNQPMLRELARESRRRGIKFGVYAMCYLTMSKEQVGGYRYSLEVKDGVPVPTRAISIGDEKRVADLIALLKSWRDIPEVDFIGLDYIRNPLGGYELAEQFFAEMPGVRPPPGWAALSPDERMVWFARKKIMRRDAAFIDAWQWWRAHKVAAVVRRIKAALGPEKPLWAFTLTWDKGWHHGQDPVMISDAGVDVDALMLYEADREQFDLMLRDWSRYLKRSDAQLIVGDVVDWPLHQRDPEGPAEFSRRSMAAIDRIYSDGPARGVFVHDLERALWGRRGPWSVRAWMDEARRVVRYMKSKS